MNHAGSLRSRCALAHRPGLDLHLASGKEALQAQQVVGSLCKHIQTRLLKTQALQVLGSLLCVELRELRLYLGTDGNGLYTVNGVKVVAEHVLIDICHIKNRLHREQEQTLGSKALLVGHFHGGGTVAVVEPIDQALGNLKLRSQLLIALGLLL